MSGSYPAARVAAERLEKHLAQKALHIHGPSSATAMEQIISAAFWASLRQEEGRAPKISLALLPPEQALNPLKFDPWLPLLPDRLARMAPAVERPGIHLGVWWKNGELAVWGSARTVPKYCFVLEVVAPGLLVAKYRHTEEATKFANFAVLEGAEVKFIDQVGPIVRSLSAVRDLESVRLQLSVRDLESVRLQLAAADPERVHSQPAAADPESVHSQPAGDDPESVLAQLAISIRAHGRGGSLLVVPRNSSDWRQSIVRPLTYSVVPPHSEISMLLKREDSAAALRSAVAALAGFTAVDGATIVSEDFELLAFGAKITRRDGSERVQQVILTEPIQGAAHVSVDPAQLGGTRHLSAAQFVHDQRKSMALVASQDGRFTVFTWSEPDQAVHARRIESLLI